MMRNVKSDMENESGRRSVVNEGRHLTLADRLHHRISREGPITFRDWMETALYDPEDGYYCRRDRERWGREGDYRTGSERTVLFAATFARYFTRLYQELGSPAHWTIFEAGAGAGHFAEGVLDTLQQRFPAVSLATAYVIDERSADSRSTARNRLSRFGTRVNFQRLSEIDQINPGIVFANELLDAFPVHRVTMRAGQLCEFYVGINDDGRFEWSIGPLSTPRLAEYFERFESRLAEGRIAEVNLEAENWLAQVSEKLKRGFLVIVDYGADADELYRSARYHEGTLRAFSRHRFAEDVLARPREQDITTTIDWTVVKLISERIGFQPVEFERQDRFLRKAGLLEELEARASEALDESERSRIRTSAREMILPESMAASFQVLVQEKVTSLTY